MFLVHGAPGGCDPQNICAIAIELVDMEGVKEVETSTTLKENPCTY